MDSCMFWLLKPDHLRPTEFAPAMDESTGILPGLPSVMGKPVHVAFDGGRLTSDAGILLLAAIEQRLGITEVLRRDRAIFHRINIGAKALDTADSDDIGRAFRLMSATCSDRSRPAVPIDVGRGGGAPA